MTQLGYIDSQERRSKFQAWIFLFHVLHIAAIPISRQESQGTLQYPQAHIGRRDIVQILKIYWANPKPKNTSSKGN
jgi:hypothetical protein